MQATKLDPNSTLSYCERFWDDHIVPTITEYIKIPNKSPVFDPKWDENGHMEDALQLALKWLEKHPVKDATLKVGRIEGRTPLILLDVPGEIDDTVLLYGHLDKQPEMEGWDTANGLAPWTPVYRDGKLYGRGGADDGYALFASICAINAVKEQGGRLPRCVIMIEFSEESGSPDLPAYVDFYAEEIGSPSLVVCLDSGAGNYDQLWSTTSLRGVLVGTVKAEVLTEGVHSGDASGVVPESFRVLRQLINRLEDVETGQLIPADLHVEIPAQRVEQAREAARFLGEDVKNKYPFLDNMEAVVKDNVEQILNRTWRGTLTITGADGLPASISGGNVMRPYTTLKLSFRIPPTLEGEIAQKRVIELLTQDPPYGAKITCDFEHSATGWNAPHLAEWLNEALTEVSQTFYGKPCLHMGEGGSIPFMGMLGEKFPKAQFVVTGVLGPQSNAHGPNEFLHVPYAKKLTACVAHLLDIHAKQHG